MFGPELQLELLGDRVVGIPPDVMETLFKLQKAVLLRTRFPARKPADQS
jgi:hypothetical protein